MNGQNEALLTEEEAINLPDTEKTVEDTTPKADKASENANADTEPEVDEANEISDDDYYKSLIEEDLRELRRLFPEARNIKDITELENPLRYARLRDLGLTSAEAYLATSPKRQRIDTRSHLSSAVSRMASAPNGRMPRADLERARELFDGMSDSEIQNLYKKVTK